MKYATLLIRNSAGQLSLCTIIFCLVFGVETATEASHCGDSFMNSKD